MTPQKRQVLATKARAALQDRGRIAVQAFLALAEPDIEACIVRQEIEDALNRNRAPSLSAVRRLEEMTGLVG